MIFTPVLARAFEEFDRFLEMEELLNLVVVVFALVLFALSITAYRKTNLRRLLFVSLAFGLFAVRVLIRQVDVFVFSIGVATLRVISVIMDLVILLLFFLALVLNR